MRLTIELDTNDITAHDRRVLAALVSDDTTPLALPHYRDLSQPGAPLVPDHAPPAPAAGVPSPTPAPPEFLRRLGEATAQFGRSPGAAHEARLPVAQQAGVSTRSTMPADDDVDELPADDPRDDVLVPTRWGRPADRQPEPSDDDTVIGVDVAGDTATMVAGAVRDGVLHIDEPVLHIVDEPRPPVVDDGPPVQRMTETARIPRASVELDPVPAHASRDRVRKAILGTVDAPVRHTSP